MWDLLEMRIQSFPLGSFVAMLVAFGGLGSWLMRGGADRWEMPNSSREAMALGACRRAEPHALSTHGRLAG